MKKITALILAICLTASLAACSSSSSDNTTTSPATTGGDSGAAATPDAPDYSAAGVTIDQLTLGTDYTDITAELRFKTQRTDLVENGVLMDKYVAEFQKMYPNITISYEGITNYAGDMTTRISTPDWGEICMIPPTIPLTELANYFQPLGQTAVLSETYNFADAKAFGGTTYGVSSTNNASGVLYNKKVFSDAGITSMPKTPDEFLDALQKIKHNTDAIPLYTNFAAGWTMTAWDAYIGGTATGDPDFINIVLPHAKNPFADRGDGTGPYAVYYVLYEAVARGLIEDDPATTDWESCKGRINNGEIGTMVLGSWAVTQMQDAGPNPDDIGYMPFPITVGGKQYTSAGPDYCYGINVNSPDKEKLAAMLYVKYLVEQSNFDFNEGGIPTVKSHPMPDTLKDFDGVALVANNPPKDGEEDLFTNINTDSEVGIDMSPDHVNDIVESALSGAKTLDDIVAGWNERWTAAQEKYGA
jgi:ABC-type glycerol-3-phosphate transport system substrate-binding protein